MIPRALFLAAFVAGSALAVETPISTPPPGPTPSAVRAVGATALGDGFLGVWVERLDCEPTSELRGMRFDRQLHTLDERSFLIASFATIIGTASDGKAAYVAWWTQNSSSVLIGHLARVDPDGTVTPMSDAIPFAGTPVAFRVSRDYFVFLSTDFASHGALTVTLLDRRGGIVRSNVPVVDPAASVSDSDAVVTDTTLVIAWIGDGTVYTAGVFLADIAADRVPLPPVQPQSGSAIRPLRLVSDGTHITVFWFTYGAADMRARSLNALGKPIDAAPVMVGAFWARPPFAAIALRDGYQLVFLDGMVSETVSLRTNFDGTLRSATRVAPLLGSVALARNGGDPVAVHREPRNTLNDGNTGIQAVASTVATDGSVGPGALLSLNAPLQHVRKLLPFAGGAAALWTESAPNVRLAVGRVSAAGKPLDGAGLRLLNSPYDQLGSAVATDGERLAVVWTEGEPSKPRRLYLALVAFSGGPVASVQQLAADAGLAASDVGISWTSANYVVTWQRRLPANKYDLAALRIDRFGNLIDPLPVSLQPASYTDVRPRLVSNGSAFLLLWERWYDPFFYIGETSCLPPVVLPNELFAQRFTAALTPDGAPIPLVTTTNTNDYLIDAQSDEISFGGGVWMISWLEKRSSNLTFARIDAAGRRLEPLNGRSVAYTCGGHFQAQASAGWTIASRDRCVNGLEFFRLAADGTATAPVSFPLPGTLEAFALAPQPMMAYTRSGSSAAFIDVVPPPRSRAARH